MEPSGAQKIHGVGGSSGGSGVCLWLCRSGSSGLTVSEEEQVGFPVEI